MKFSITIPTFKSLYLTECIESVLTQTYSDFELIIVNDNSPENIDDIIKRFSDDRIRYYKNSVGFGAENVVGNWNKCLEYATGDYIICMGDDDKLKSNFLQDLADLIGIHSDLDVYYSRTELIDERSTAFKVLEKRPERQSVYEMIYDRWNGGSMFIGDYCFRVDALRARGGFYFLPYAWGSDAISAYEGGMRAGIANTQEVGFQYRVNQNSISSETKNTEGKIHALFLQRKWFEDFLSHPANLPHDEFLRVKLYASIADHYDKMYTSDIVHSMQANRISQFVYWMRNRNKYKIKMSLIIKCLIYSFVKN